MTYCKGGEWQENDKPKNGCLLLFIVLVFAIMFLLLIA